MRNWVGQKLLAALKLEQRESLKRPQQNCPSSRIDNMDHLEMEELFHIDPDTGVITTKKEFDREEREVYALTVIAEDGAPSSLLKDGRPNQTANTFRIVIKDKNEY